MTTLFFIILSIFNIFVLFLVVSNTLSTIKDHRYFTSRDLVGIVIMYICIVSDIILATLYIFTR